MLPDDRNTGAGGDDDDEDNDSNASDIAPLGRPSAVTPRTSTLDNAPTQKVAVLVLLGAMQEWPHEAEEELCARIRRKLRSRLELCGVPKSIAAKGEVEIRSVYWPAAFHLSDGGSSGGGSDGGGGGGGGDGGGGAPPAEAAGTTAAPRTAAGAVAPTGPTQRALADLMRFCSQYTPRLASAPAAQSTPPGCEAVAAAHRMLDTALAELANAAGDRAPLVVVAHHVGCVLALKHIERLQTMAAAAGQAPSSDASAAAPAGSAAPIAREELLQKGHTLAALFTLGCPMPAFLLAGGGAAAINGGETAPYDAPPAAADAADAAAAPAVVEVPSPTFWSCRAMRNICENAPRAVLRWSNYWHPSDPLAYPVGAVLRGCHAADVSVKLNERSVEVDGLDYIGQHGSREILSPLAYTLTRLWLAANPHVDGVDTTQLEELLKHGSGTRAILSRQGGKAAALAKQKAQAAREKVQAGRFARSSVAGTPHGLAAAGALPPPPPPPMPTPMPAGAAGAHAASDEADDAEGTPVRRLQSQPATPTSSQPSIGSTPMTDLGASEAADGDGERSRTQGSPPGGPSSSLGSRALFALRKVEAKVAKGGAKVAAKAKAKVGSRWHAPQRKTSDMTSE